MTSSIRQYTSPPIQRADGTLATDRLGKQKTLRDELLTAPPHTNNEDMEYPDLFSETRQNPAHWYPCSMQEIESGIFHAGNTSPGADEIPPIIVKKAWSILQEEIS